MGAVDAQPVPAGLTLEALVGVWRTTGRTYDGAPVEATDTYEWLPGRCALLHRVDARVGDVRVEGAEIIGWDPLREAYVTQYFGTDGSSRYEAWFRELGGVTVWRMCGERDRFMGAISDDGATIEGHWELRDGDSGWRPWMDVTLTRVANGRAAGR
jgi:hypothetical protein